MRYSPRTGRWTGKRPDAYKPPSVDPYGPRSANYAERHATSVRQTESGAIIETIGEPLPPVDPAVEGPVTRDEPPTPTAHSFPKKPKPVPAVPAKPPAVSFVDPLKVELQDRFGVGKAFRGAKG